MKIRLKMAIVNFLTGLLVILSAIYLAENSVMNHFVSIEHSQVIRDVGRVNDALLEKMRSVDATTHDYATWDTSYYGTDKETSQYNNMDLAGSLKNTKLDFIVVIRNDGKIVSAMDFFSGVERSYNATIDDLDTKTFYFYFEKNYASLICRNDSVYFNGFLQLPKGLAIMSSRPVLKSDGTGPVQATLIFGKMLDSSFAEQISAQTHSFFFVQPYVSVSYEDKLKLNMFFGADASSSINTTKDPDSHLNASSNNSSGDNSTYADIPVQVLPLNEENISGYGLLNDIYGKPAALLVVTEPRTVYLEGKTAVGYIIEAMIVVVLIFIALEYFLFNKIFLSRIIHKSRQLKEIREKKSVSLRITVSGDDELATLGKDINSTLDYLENIIEEKQAVFDADTHTYFYTDYSWKIIDYKLSEEASSVLLKDIPNSEVTNLSKIFSPDMMRKLSRARSDSIRKRESSVLELTIHYRGALRIFETRVMVVNSANNNNCLVLLEDVSDRKKIEHVLMEKNKDLEKFNKFAIDRELKMHELKNEIRDLEQRKEKSPELP